MEVDVNCAWQQQLSARVDGLAGVYAAGTGAEDGDSARVYADIKAGDAGFQYDICVGDEGVDLQGVSPTEVRFVFDENGRIGDTPLRRL